MFTFYSHGRRNNYKECSDCFRPIIFELSIIYASAVTYDYAQVKKDENIQVQTPFTPYSHLMPVVVRFFRPFVQNRLHRCCMPALWTTTAYRRCAFKKVSTCYAMHLICIGNRAFSVAAARACGVSLQYSLTAVTSLTLFRRRFKTELFSVHHDFASF